MMMNGKAILLVLLFSSSLALSFSFLTYPSISQVQLKADGSVYAIQGRQLIMLNTQFSLVQNVSLSSAPLKMTLVNEEQSLAICMVDGTCAFYNTSDLSAPWQASNLSLASKASFALFSSGNDVHLGVSSNSSRFTLSREDATKQHQYNPSNQVYSSVNPMFLERKFLFGFSEGDCSYYLVYDKEDYGTSFATPLAYTMRVMRACHNSSCCSVGSGCSFTSLSEDFVKCGALESSNLKNVCGVSAIRDYGGRSGLSIVISVCNEESLEKTDTVCLISVDDIDHNMDQAYDLCVTQQSTCVQTIWSQVENCNTLMVKYYRAFFIYKIVFLTLNRCKEPTKIILFSC